MKKMIIAIVIAVTLIISGIVATVVIINTPSIIMMPTISTALSDFMKREDIKQVQKVLEKGSVEFDVLDEESNTDVNGKLYFALDEYKMMAENIEIKRGYVSLSGDFYFSQDLCYAKNEEILGGTLGIKAGNAAEEFEKSIFAFGSGSKYSVSKESHDIIYEILTAMDEDLPAEMKKDSAKLMAKYFSNIQSSISKYGAFSSENSNVKVGTTHMDARIMTLTLDETAIASIVTDLLTLMSEDESLKDFVYTYGDKLDSVLNDSEDLYDSLIKKINTRISTIKDDVKGQKIVLSVITQKLSTKLLSFTLNIEKDGDKDVYSADFGPKGVKNSDHIVLNLNGTVVEYKRGSDAKSFSIVVEDFAKVTYYLDGKGGFELALLLFYEGEERYSVSGNIKSEKNVTYYDITNYKYTYNKDGQGEFENIEEKALDITVNISTKDKMPSPADEYEDFLELDEERLAIIEQNFVAIFGEK